jgi:hypothetical protein
VVLGGLATLRWDVTRTGAPLLRQLVDLTDPEWLAWPGLLAGRQVLATALLAGQIRARTIVATPTAVAQRLAADAALVTVLSDDAATARHAADQLCARLRNDSR